MSKITITITTDARQSALILFSQSPALGLFLACALSLGCVNCLRADSIPAWNLVWSDEFDGPSGSAPNPAFWIYDLGGGGWGNNELESYTSRRQNSRIENGNLVIEARRGPYTGTDGPPRT